MMFVKHTHSDSETNRQTNPNVQAHARLCSVSGSFLQFFYVSVSMFHTLVPKDGMPRHHRREAHVRASRESTTERPCQSAIFSLTWVRSGDCFVNELELSIVHMWGPVLTVSTGIFLCSDSGCCLRSLAWNGSWSNDSLSKHRICAPQTLCCMKGIKAFEKVWARLFMRTWDFAVLIRSPIRYLSKEPTCSLFRPMRPTFGSDIWWPESAQSLVVSGSYPRQAHANI